MERHPRHDAGISCHLEHFAVVSNGPLVVGSLFGLQPSPLQRQPMMDQAQSRQPTEVLGVPCGETVPVAREGSVAGLLPFPPVRRRSRTLALGGRGPGAPHEAFRPAHVREYAKQCTPVFGVAGRATPQGMKVLRNALLNTL